MRLHFLIAVTQTSHAQFLIAAIVCCTYRRAFYLCFKWRQSLLSSELLKIAREMFASATFGSIASGPKNSLPIQYFCHLFETRLSTPRNIVLTRQYYVEYIHNSITNGLIRIRLRLSFNRRLADRQLQQSEYELISKVYCTYNIEW